MLWIDLLRPSLSTLYATWQGCLPRTLTTLLSAHRPQQAFAELAHRIVKPATPALADDASKVCISMICPFQPASDRTVYIANPQQTWSARKPRVEQNTAIPQIAQQYPKIACASSPNSACAIYSRGPSQQLLVSPPSQLPISCRRV